jgi:hypothetical protein
VAVVELLAGPSLLSWLMDLKLENVSVLDLVTIRADVVDDLPELAHNTELAEAGFLARFAQGGVFGGFSRPNTSGRDLETDVLQVIVSVAEDQQLAIPDDVAHHFAGVDLVRHSFRSWLDGLAWKAATALPCSQNPPQRGRRLTVSTGQDAWVIAGSGTTAATVGLRITSLFPTLSAVSGARGLWLPAAALTGEGPKPRLPRVPAVDNCSVGDDVVQRATITPYQDA